MSLGGPQISMEILGDEVADNFDYVMVFKNNKIKDEPGKYSQSKYAKDCCYAMLNAGLELYSYNSIQDDELIVLIRAPIEILMAFADKINFKMKLDPVVAKARLESDSAKKNEKTGVPERKAAFINEDKRYFPNYYPPYEYIYGKFEREDGMMDLYQCGEGKESKTRFTSLVRLKLIYFLLEADSRSGGCKLPIQTLLHDEAVSAFFPLHDLEIATELKAQAMKFTTMPWSFDVDRIRSYFGEKYALFFTFAGHYSWTLVIPALVGLPFQLAVWGTGPDYSHPVLPFYGLLIGLWAVIMLEYWKRLEVTKALEWGMSDFEAEEPDRAEFYGDPLEPIPSPVDGQDFTFFPAATYRNKLRTSLATVTVFIGCVIGVIAGIYVFRFKLQAKYPAYSSAIASILNAVQIQVFNLVYGYLTVALAEWENHRTDTAYQESFISKLFVFQFVNSYASFFFIAFIAPFLPPPPGLTGVQGQCGDINCMRPLSINLVTIFGTKLTVTNGLSMILPWNDARTKRAAETAKLPEGVDASQMTRAEEDYILLEFNGLLDDIFNYADLTIEFGYMILFVVALPIAPMFSLINSYIKLKFVLWKQLSFYQRPVPLGGQDIGTWMSIFQVFMGAAIISNAALIVFTMSVLPSYTTMGKLWIFIGFQYVLFAAQWFLAYGIEDVPAKVRIQLKRQDFIVDKLINKIPDEEAEDSPGETHDQNGESKKLAEIMKSSTKKSGDSMPLRYTANPLIPVLEKPLKDKVPLQGVRSALVYSRKTVRTRIEQVNGRPLSDADLTALKRTSLVVEEDDPAPPATATASLHAPASAADSDDEYVDDADRIVKLGKTYTLAKSEDECDDAAGEREGDEDRPSIWNDTADVGDIALIESDGTAVVPVSASAASRE